MRKRGVVKFKLPGGSTFPLNVPLPPSEVGGKFWQIQKIHPGDAQKWTIVSDRQVSMWTHFLPSGTVPCLAEVTRQCEACAHKIARRYQAFCACWRHDTREIVIVPLTRNAVETCPALRNEEQLAGRQLTVKRKGHLRSRVVAEVTGRPVFHIDKANVVTQQELLAQVFWIFGFVGEIEIEQGSSVDDDADRVGHMIAESEETQ